MAERVSERTGVLLALLALTALPGGAWAAAPRAGSVLPLEIAAASGVAASESGDGGLIGTDEVHGANRAYIVSEFRRRSMRLGASGAAGCCSMNDAADFAAATTDYADGYVEQGRFIGQANGQGAALGAVDPPPAPGRGPGTVTSAMLLAGLGLLGMVARRRTLAR